MYYFQYLVARAAAFILGRLPFSASSWVAARAGDLFYFLLPRRRRTALENLGRAFGKTIDDAEKRRIARESFRNTAMSVMELFLIEKFRRHAHERFRIEGLENYRAALARGKGVVLITSHLGSWEFLAFLFYLTATRCSVIVKDIRNPYLNRKIDALRRVSTLNPIPKLNSIRPVLQELRKKHTVAILIDQWAGDEGIWLEFFGEPTSTTSVPARLAKRTGCALLPAYCLRTGPGMFEIQVQPHLEVKEEEGWEEKTTLALNRGLESHIRKYPEQWSWGHRRWKKRPASLRETTA